MRRREYVAGLVTTAAMGMTKAICGQKGTGSPCPKPLAIVHPVRPPEQLTLNGGNPAYKVYFEELNRLGFVEGKNLIVERYSALGQPSRIADLAREIIASRPDVILPMSGVFIK